MGSEMCIRDRKRKITKKEEKIALREGKRGRKSGGEGIAEKEGLQGFLK